MKSQSDFHSFIGVSVFSLHIHDFLCILRVLKYHIVFFFIHPNRIYGSFKYGLPSPFCSMFCQISLTYLLVHLLMLIWGWQHGEHI